jgi:hypothetical protein
MKILEKIYTGFVTFLGDIKLFKFPFFMLYDPGSYLVKGDDIRQVLKIVQPGDILVRGYINYLDGYIIPGLFSHAGLYLGEVKERDGKDLKKGQLKDFKAGEQIIIHSMAEGVFMEDIINFCRCDYMAILRRRPKIESKNDKKYTFSRAFKKALGYLGAAYDFAFDFENFHKLSCTELVYACYKDILPTYGVDIKFRRVMFIKKRIIIPDDYVNSKLQMVWKSKSVSDNKIIKIKSKK